jgi:hypothetical protein
MKNILMAACCTVIMFAANNAKAFCENQACAASISGDSGTTLKNCTDTQTAGNNCECTEASTGAPSVKITTGICGQCWALESYMMDGKKCCGWIGSRDSKICNLPEAANDPDVIATKARAETRVNEIYESNFDGSRTNEYFGYAGSVLRSPSNGRAGAPMAKLDACLDHPDVTAIDNYVGTADDKHHQCVGASMGCGTTLKNEYCQASGTNDGATVSAAVCKDRCDCVYPGAEGSACGGN